MGALVSYYDIEFNLICRAKNVRVPIKQAISLQNVHIVDHCAFTSFIDVTATDRAVTIGGRSYALIASTFSAQYYLIEESNITAPAPGNPEHCREIKRLVDYNVQNYDGFIIDDLEKYTGIYNIEGTWIGSIIPETHTYPYQYELLK